LKAEFQLPEGQYLFGTISDSGTKYINFFSDSNSKAMLFFTLSGSSLLKGFQLKGAVRKDHPRMKKTGIFT
jgi:hypothetical protein